jgi:hypothetical protein
MFSYQSGNCNRQPSKVRFLVSNSNLLALVAKAIQRFLLLFKVDGFEREIPMGIENLETPLLLLRIGFLIRK